MHLVAIIIDGHLGELAFNEQAFVKGLVEVGADGLREASLVSGAHDDQAYAVQLLRHSQGPLLIEVISNHHCCVELGLGCVRDEVDSEIDV